MALTWRGCDVSGELANKQFMSWGRVKKRGVKISRPGIKSEPPRCVKQPPNSFTVPLFDTVRLASLRAAVSNLGHIYSLP